MKPSEGCIIPSQAVYCHALFFWILIPFSHQNNTEREIKTEGSSSYLAFCIWLSWILVYWYTGYLFPHTHGTDQANVKYAFNTFPWADVSSALVEMARMWLSQRNYRQQIEAEPPYFERAKWKWWQEPDKPRSFSWGGGGEGNDDSRKNIQL